jgi:hypothetical protein
VHRTPAAAASHHHRRRRFAPLLHLALLVSLLAAAATCCCHWGGDPGDGQVDRLDQIVERGWAGSATTMRTDSIRRSPSLTWWPSLLLPVSANISVSPLPSDDASLSSLIVYVHNDASTLGPLALTPPFTQPGYAQNYFVSVANSNYNVRRARAPLLLRRRRGRRRAGATQQQQAQATALDARLLDESGFNVHLNSFLDAL